jgi:hypothetical protein
MKILFLVTGFQNDNHEMVTSFRSFQGSLPQDALVKKKGRQEVDSRGPEFSLNLKTKEPWDHFGIPTAPVHSFKASWQPHISPVPPQDPLQ